VLRLQRITTERGESWYYLRLIQKEKYGRINMELNPVYNRIQDYQERSEVLRGYL